MGRYNLDLADVDTQRKRFDLYNAVCDGCPSACNAAAQWL
jgi:hypothetical protein